MNQPVRARTRPAAATLARDETPAIMTPAEEKRIAKALSPGVAWPTLAMAVALPALQWTLVGLGLARGLPLWACASILVVTSYAHYTLVHEAIHGNLAPGFPRLRWINAVVGWAGALGLGFNWPMLMRTHALHHAHTNTEDDPDFVAKGTFGELVVKWAIAHVALALVPLFALRFISPAKYRTVEQALQPTEVLQASAVTILIDVLLVAALSQGRGFDWLCLLFIPTRLGALILMIFFQWLPHHPFDRSERYLNTRISLWPGAAVLTLQQNLHLMHHLWPSVPFYNYARLYQRLRPILIARGSRIEGFRVGRHARDRSQG